MPEQQQRWYLTLGILNVPVLKYEYLIYILYTEDFFIFIFKDQGNIRKVRYLYI